MPEIAPRLRRAAAAALGAAGPECATELAVVLTDDAQQRALNAQWRGEDKPTNVLAFPAAMDADDLPPDTNLPLGDVVLALETVAREAELQGKSLVDHAAHLTIHGVLHLLGHEHDRPQAAARMETLETALLASLGIADPYRAPVKDTAMKRAAGR